MHKKIEFKTSVDLFLMFNDKFLAEMLMYDFNIANKQKINWRNEIN